MHSSHIANRNTQADLYIFKQMFTNKIHFSTAINGDDLAGILPKIDPTLLFKYCFPNFKNYRMFAKIGFPKLVNHHPDFRRSQIVKIYLVLPGIISGSWT